jgi:hypothetical protein
MTVLRGLMQLGLTNDAALIIVLGLHVWQSAICGITDGKCSHSRMNGRHSSIVRNPHCAHSSV